VLKIVFCFFQGSYPGVFVDQLFPLHFFVIGSLQYYNRGVFAGQIFQCSNRHHHQVSQFSRKKKCFVTKPRGFIGKVKKMRPSKALQVALCRSEDGVVFTPDTDIINVHSSDVRTPLSIDVARLTMFVVVLKEWVDFQNRLVVLPDRLHVKIGDKVQHSIPPKSVFDVNGDDHEYFSSNRSDLLGNRKLWREFSFNNCCGPFITLAEAVSFRDEMNRTFVKEMQHLKTKYTNSERC
jgi:hypothetical protein